LGAAEEEEEEEEEVLRPSVLAKSFRRRRNPSGLSPQRLPIALNVSVLKLP
jgi:hypothetical protein